MHLQVGYLVWEYAVGVIYCTRCFVTVGAHTSIISPHHSSVARRVKIGQVTKGGEVLGAAGPLLTAQRFAIVFISAIAFLRV